MARKKREVDPVLAQERAVRLKCLREMTGLSRDMINSRYNIARGTLQNWESARFGGLTDKGAEASVKAMRAEGIDVTIEWLLHGLGQPPKFSPKLSHALNYDKSITDQPGYEKATQELMSFKKGNSNAIDFIVADDSMEPKFYIGDIVAGNKHYLDAIESTIGQNCIVQTSIYGTLIRQIRQGDEPGKYHLFALNWQSEVTRPIMYNVEILSAAPIIWTRAVARKPIIDFNPDHLQSRPLAVNEINS